MMLPRKCTRRRFARDVLLLGGAAAALPWTRWLAAQARAEFDPVAAQPAQLDWEARLSPPGEPGDPLEVTGTVFAPDGEHSVAGIVVYAYHTDARGLYTPSNTPREGPRLRGWMRTGADGRFRLHSIRPAPYPNREVPAHVHFNLWGAGYPRQWTESLLFEGDPLLNAERMEHSRQLGRFANVRALARGADGLWRCTFDLKVQTVSNFRD